MFLDRREFILRELKEISANPSRAEYLIAELRQNDRDLSSDEGTYMGKRTVKAAVTAYLLESPDQRASLEDIVNALSPDQEGPDAAKSRGNVRRSIRRMDQTNSDVVISEDDVVSFRRTLRKLTSHRDDLTRRGAQANISAVSTNGTAGWSPLREK